MQIDRSEVIWYLFRHSWAEINWPTQSRPAPDTLVILQSPAFKGSYKGAVQFMQSQANKRALFPIGWQVARLNQRYDYLADTVAYVRKKGRFFRPLESLYDDPEDMADLPVEAIPMVICGDLTTAPVRFTQLVSLCTNRGYEIEDTVDFDGVSLSQTGFSPAIVAKLFEFDQAFALYRTAAEPDPIVEERYDGEDEADRLLGIEKPKELPYVYEAWSGIKAGLRDIECSEEEALAWERECLHNYVIQEREDLNGPVRIIERGNKPQVGYQICQG